MLLNIIYSPELEVQRIMNTLAKIKWYKDNGYIPTLPRDVESENNVRRYVQEHFDVAEYSVAVYNLNLEFNHIRKEFVSKLKDFLKREIPSVLNVVLTKYGVGGSYVLPNKVILNISGNQSNKPLVAVLKHEIIHLLVEGEVQARKLTHKQKEEFVRSIERKINNS